MDQVDQTDARWAKLKGVACAEAPICRMGPNAGRPSYAGIGTEQAAGIATEFTVSQVISRHSGCVICPPACSHTVCKAAELGELVSNRQRLTPPVTTAIPDLARRC
jgi:hypothetical protein